MQKQFSCYVFGSYKNNEINNKFFLSISISSIGNLNFIVLKKKFFKVFFIGFNKKGLCSSQFLRSIYLTWRSIIVEVTSLSHMLFFVCVDSFSLTCLKSCVGPHYTILGFLLWWWPNLLKFNWVGGWALGIILK